MRQILRGEVYIADIPKGIGCEQTGERPVLILQNNKGNCFSPTTIVALITSEIKKTELPTHVVLDEVVLNRPSMIMFEQIRTIDKNRLRNKIGEVPTLLWEKELLISLGVN